MLECGGVHSFGIGCIDPFPEGLFFHKVVIDCGGEGCELSYELVLIGG
jgi:hypothetical protein